MCLHQVTQLTRCHPLHLHASPPGRFPQSRMQALRWERGVHEQRPVGQRSQSRHAPPTGHITGCCHEGCSATSDHGQTEPADARAPDIWRTIIKPANSECSIHASDRSRRPSPVQGKVSSRNASSRANEEVDMPATSRSVRAMGTGVPSVSFAVHLDR